MAGYEVIANDWARMPTSSGWKQCKEVHIDSMVGRDGKPLKGGETFEGKHYFVQDAYTEFSSRLAMIGGPAVKLMILGEMFLLNKLRHVDGSVSWDSQRFGDADVLLRVPTAHQVECIEGDDCFIQIWRKRDVLEEMAIMVMDRDLAKDLGQMYHTKSPQQVSRLL
jgi:hypothetical protein